MAHREGHDGGGSIERALRLAVIVALVVPLAGTLGNQVGDVLECMHASMETAEACTKDQPEAEAEAVQAADGGAGAARPGRRPPVKAVVAADVERPATAAAGSQRAAQAHQARQAAQAPDAADASNDHSDGPSAEERGRSGDAPGRAKAAKP